MSDFLTRLIERTQGVVQVAQPIIPPMFALVSNSLSDYSQNSLQDSEPVNVLNREIVTPPTNDSSSATLNQSFQRTSGRRFAPHRQVEPDLSEQVKSTFSPVLNDQTEHGIIKHSSNLTSPENPANSERPKEKFDGNNESPANTLVSQYAQNNRLLTEQPLETIRDASGRRVDSEQSNAPRNLPDAERNQNIGTQSNHLSNDERDVSVEVIKTERVCAPQEKAEGEPDQNIGLQPEHSLNEKREPSEGLIDSNEASALREITEIKHGQKSLQPEHSLNEKQDAPREPIYYDRARALRKLPESTEVKSDETSYLKPHSSGKIRFQQDAETEPSSSESTIKVTIGRVEVRAIMPSVHATPAPLARSQSPILSLNDFLKQRNEGQR